MSHAQNSQTSASATTGRSGGSVAAQNIGDKVGGALHVAHGAGEGIRGNINAFMDNVGEQIAGRGGEGCAKAESRSQDPKAVAANGADELQAGMNDLKKK
ncbi:hypothetical protein BD324DRAFT_652487 [Kockovaella imperatae]|uniref:Uncharacterized protein n=1 Tax=Kockovaella imperatae TaxID=4999 RepID=A0A1Y1UBH2_9TREE|nr:hypothetical protein BD324DRAFT_652487 [Kockovaella imperatae]ORX35352.1 hypothetical protein BD324DRAFT_652487 [Kockovaella imperatae]